MKDANQAQEKVFKVAVDDVSLASGNLHRSTKAGWYKKYRIPKASGGVRLLEEPIPWLKEMQREIYDSVLLKYCKISRKAYGCVKGRGIAGAAADHVSKPAVLRIDLKDCFPNIDAIMIYNALTKENGLSKSIAARIAFLCTNEDGVLPQGSPSSPSLANIVMCKMYSALWKAAEKNGLQFTGYLDDLIFSGDKDKIKKFVGVAKSIIKVNKMHPNPKKIIIMRNKREVLGCCVAAGKDHTRLPKKLRNRIRAYVHILERDFDQGKLKDINKLFMYTQGLVAFAQQVGDQKAQNFKNRLTILRHKITGGKNVGSAEKVAQHKSD